MRQWNYESRSKKLKEFGLFSYQQYLDSDEWATRKWIYELENTKRCVFCGSKDRVDLHHRSYDRLGNEADDDLMWLCRTHHQEYHDTGQMPQKPTEQQVEALEDIGYPAAAIKTFSQREAARKIYAAQERLLRQHRDDDNDWLCTDANTKTWIERN